MKLKNMWKRFWTLDVHNHEGFTLVELIIVIAILAILSTGAIAGYSAYIKSANNAAVEAVLSDISTAAVLANAKGGAVSSIEATVVEGKLQVVVTLDSVASDFDSLFEGSVKATGAFGTGDDANVWTGTLTLPSAWNNSDYADGASWTGSDWE